MLLINGKIKVSTQPVLRISTYQPGAETNNSDQQIENHLDWTTRCSAEYGWPYRDIRPRTDPLLHSFVVNRLGVSAHIHLDKSGHRYHKPRPRERSVLDKRDDTHTHL